MSLTTDDLTQIRTIMREEVSAQLAPTERRVTSIDENLKSVDGRLIAIENDVKDIYEALQKADITVG